MEQYQRTLNAAQGYCELQMYVEAIEELASLPHEVQGEPVVIEMHLVTFMQAKEWDAALMYGRVLCSLRPAELSGFIHTAFCLHEMGRTADAKAFLLTGPPPAGKDQANYYYNLACYECVLGHTAEARELLTKTFALEPKYREFAKTDTDLQALRTRERKAE